MTETVLVSLEAGVLKITLNRPDKMNAFNEDMHLAFRSAIQRAHDDDAVRAVLLTGSGRGFCAGQDLNDRDPRKMTGKPDLGYTLETYFNPVLRLILSLQKPVIAAVNGVAAGAGANIALACDIVFAASSARFIQAFSRIGLTPDAGGSWILANQLGMARAKGLAMTAQPLSAEMAVEWGLIWKAVPDEKLMDEAGLLAASLAAGPTRSYGLTKMSLHAATANSFDTQLDVERDIQRLAGQTEDYAEGVTAFLTKRPPVFKGR